MAHKPMQQETDTQPAAARSTRRPVPCVQRGDVVRREGDEA